MLALPGAAHAQSSQKPLQIIVPFAPGGSADGIGRILAAELSAKLGRQVYVENKPGAGGSLGLTILAKAPPDGDTIAIAATGALVINPHVPGSTGFDPVKELAPVAKLIDIPLVIVANPKTGPKTIKDMIEQSKAKPGGLSYGSTGVNSSQHLAVEMFKKVTGANLVHIPYRGSGPAALAAVAGDVPLTSTDLTAAHENIKAGNLTALGVTSAKRSKLAPEFRRSPKAACRASSGAPGFIGVVAPLGTPPAVIRQLSSEIAAIVARPDVQAKIASLSVEPGYADEASVRRRSRRRVGQDGRKSSRRCHRLSSGYAQGFSRMTYRAPVADIAFTLKHGAGLRARSRKGGELTADDVDAVLEEAGRFATDVLAPLNAVGDKFGTPFKDGAVTMPPGWKEAYRGWAAAGWNAVSLPAQWGGQALPHALNAACIEMWNSASMAFGIGPVLTMGAVEALGELRHRRAQEDLSAQARLRRMDGHDAAHRAAGRLRRRRAAHQGGARRRRQLPHHRAEDLHHLRRARPHRQHHPFRAGAAARRAAGHQGHLAVPGAEVPGRTRTARSARATTCAPIRSSTSSASTPRRPAPWSTATTAAPSATWSARRTAGSPACSR